MLSAKIFTILAEKRGRSRVLVRGGIHGLVGGIKLWRENSGEQVDLRDLCSTRMALLEESSKRVRISVMKRSW